MAPGLLESAPRPITFSPSKQTSATVTEITSAPLTSTLVLHPSLITTGFDLLRFEAAAFDQLPKLTSINATSNLSDPGNQNESPQQYSADLISSPYNQPGHYLSLPTLPLFSALFAKALTALRPVVPDYATASYTSALNLDDVLNVLRDLVAHEREKGVVELEDDWQEAAFYVVVFRSKLKEGIDNDWLYKLDHESHREACESGGLLKYWFGKSNAQRQNLATCML